MFGNVLVHPTHPVHQGVALWDGMDGLVWVGGGGYFRFFGGGCSVGFPPYKKVIFSFEAFCILEEMALFISYFWAYKCEMRKTFLPTAFTSVRSTLLYSLFFYFTSLQCFYIFFFLVGRPLNWQVCCAKFLGSLAATRSP